MSTISSLCLGGCGHSDSYFTCEDGAFPCIVNVWPSAISSQATCLSGESGRDNGCSGNLRPGCSSVTTSSQATCCGSAETNREKSDDGTGFGCGHVNPPVTTNNVPGPGETGQPRRSSLSNSQSPGSGCPGVVRKQKGGLSAALKATPGANACDRNFLPHVPEGCRDGVPPADAERASGIIAQGARAAAAQAHEHAVAAAMERLNRDSTAAERSPADRQSAAAKMNVSDLEEPARGVGASPESMGEAGDSLPFFSPSLVDRLWAGRASDDGSANLRACHPLRHFHLQHQQQRQQQQQQLQQQQQHLEGGGRKRSQTGQRPQSSRCLLLQQQQQPKSGSVPLSRAMLESGASTPAAGASVDANPVLGARGSNAAAGRQVGGPAVPPPTAAAHCAAPASAVPACVSCMALVAAAAAAAAAPRALGAATSAAAAGGSAGSRRAPWASNGGGPGVRCLPPKAPGCDAVGATPPAIAAAAAAVAAISQTATAMPSACLVSGSCIAQAALANSDATAQLTCSGGQPAAAVASCGLTSAPAPPDPALAAAAGSAAAAGGSLPDQPRPRVSSAAAVLAAMAMSAFEAPRGHVHNGPRMPLGTAGSSPPAAACSQLRQHRQPQQAAVIAALAGLAVLPTPPPAAVRLNRLSACGAATGTTPPPALTDAPSTHRNDDPWVSCRREPDSPVSQASTEWEPGAASSLTAAGPAWGSGSFRRCTGGYSRASLGESEIGPPGYDRRTQWWGRDLGGGRFHDVDDVIMRRRQDGCSPAWQRRGGAAGDGGARRRSWWRWLLLGL